MAAFRPVGTRGMSVEALGSGDTELYAPIMATNTTVGAATLSAANLIAGNLFRSGSTAAYTDTMDTAANIYLALEGNGNAPAIVPGLGFTCRITNQVAYAETITLGAGMSAGQGTVTSVSASSWRDFLFTFTSVQPPISLIGNTTSASAAVTFTLQPNQVALQQGVAPTATNVMAGAVVAGTGITAGTTVIGTTQGVGGVTGITMSATATATGTNVALTFGPAISVSSSGAGTL